MTLGVESRIGGIRVLTLLRVLALVGAAVVLVRTAWLCDDAYISFRCAANWVDGFGLRWNPVERVQPFTNPLWTLLFGLCYAVTGEAFYTPLALSLAVSLATLAILAWRVAADASSGILGLALLLSCKAFVDYSTSGLENPLTHVLIVLVVWGAGRERACPPSVLGGLCGLAAVNRMDTILLLGPLFALVVLGARRGDRGRALAAAGLPVIAWVGFALVYYGVPFPNTAFAKLSAGLPLRDLLAQGLRYLQVSATIDPMTPAILLAGVAVGVRRRLSIDTALSAGCLLHVLYVVRVGGDFMSGRFLAAPVLVAAILVVRAWRPSPARRIGAAAAIAVGGLCMPHPPVLSGADYGADGAEIHHGVADERAGYYPGTGLLVAWSAPPGVAFPDHEWARMGRALHLTERAVSVWPNAGMYGFFAGPKLELIDQFGLGDPLLARLPCVDEPDWRIGHFRRVIPEGYFETRVADANRMPPGPLAGFVDDLRRLTRGALFDPERWRAIWRVNTRVWEERIDRERFRHPDALAEKISDTYADPDNPGRRMRLAEAYFAAGRPADAVGVVLAAEQRWPGLVYQYMEGADLALWRGYLQALGADPGHGLWGAWLHAAVGRALRAAADGDTARGSELALAAVERSRLQLALHDTAELWYLQAAALELLRQDEAAARAYRRCIERSPLEGTYLSPAREGLRRLQVTDR